MHLFACVHDVARQADPGMRAAHKCVRQQYLMARCVQEGNLLDVTLCVHPNSVGTNSLRNASCLSCCYLGLTYSVQQ